MATNHNPANTTPNDRNPYWWEQATECVNTLAAFLRSKQKTITMAGVNLEHGAPVFAPGYSTTLTRAQARKVAAEMLFHRVGRKDSTHIPVTRPALKKCGDRYLADALSETSHTAKGGTRPIVVRAMDGRDHDTARNIATFRASGNHFTVKGSGIVYHSRRAAVLQACRDHFKAEWDSANEANDSAARKGIKARAVAEGFILLNGEVTGVKASPSPAPKAQQSSVSSSVSAQEAKNMAKALGASGADIKTKKAAEAFLAARGISL